MRSKGLRSFSSGFGEPVGHIAIIYPKAVVQAFSYPYFNRRPEH